MSEACQISGRMDCDCILSCICQLCADVSLLLPTGEGTSGTKLVWHTSVLVDHSWLWILPYQAVPSRDEATERRPNPRSEGITSPSAAAADLVGLEWKSDWRPPAYGCR